MEKNYTYQIYSFITDLKYMSMQSNVIGDDPREKAQSIHMSPHLGTYLFMIIKKIMYL